MNPWNDQSWNSVDEAVRKWEDVGRSNPLTELKALAPPLDNPERILVLATLIKVDQEHRWRSGEHVRLADYLNLWPDLRKHSDVIEDLLRAECRTRTSVGEELPNRESLRAVLSEIMGQIDIDAIVAEFRSEESRAHSVTVLPWHKNTLLGSNRSRSAEKPALQEGTRLGRYRIQRMIGHGGMATVYLAEDEELQCQVAVKLLNRNMLSSPNEVDFLVQEARAAAQLRDIPGIVPIYDVGQTEDKTYFFVMEYVEGHSLDELLAEHAIDQQKAVEWTTQIAEALHRAHKRGFVHRDIKLANILVDRDGKARLLDFGLAIHDSTQRRRAGERSGTLPYMAPEQVRGETHRMDGRTDIWALGVVLYQMLAHRRPFGGDTANELSDEIMNRAPKPIRQIEDSVPSELEDICMKCLRKSVDERYATAGDLAKDLRRWQKPRRRIISQLSFLLAVVVFACIAVLFLTSSSTRNSSSRTPPSSSPPPLPSPPLPPLAATLEVQVLSDRREPIVLSTHDAGALPVVPGDRIRVVGRLSRAAYIYIVWIDELGIAEPVYPWTPGDWSRRSDTETPQSELATPEALNQGWAMKEGPSGTQTVLLLARDTLLPKNINCEELLAGLPELPVAAPKLLVSMVNGDAHVESLARERGPDLSIPKEVADPVLKMQAELQRRLKSHFDVICAQSFSFVGK